MFCPLVLSGALLAQSHHSDIKKRNPAVESDQSTKELNDLLAAQQRALDSGDPALIAAATRSSSARLLREVSKLRLLKGKVAEAIELQRKSIALQDLPDAHLELASILLRTGSQKDAAIEASVLLQSDPKNSAAWAIRGSAQLHTGDYQGAIEAFSHSLETRSDANVAYALASAELALHHKERAALIFQKIIEASDNAAIWHVAAGDAYREALYLPDAVEEFKKAIAIDPRVGHSEFFLGLTYLQMNEWGPNSQSFEHLRAAVRLAPREYVSNFYLGAIESTDGSDLASSNRHLQVAAEANPNAPEVWLYLGLNAAREKNTSDAKTYLRRAIELTGNDVARNNYQIRRVYAVLGRILISEGNRADGNALLQEYKRTERLSIGNSAQAIVQAGEAQEARSTLSGVNTTDESVSGIRVGNAVGVSDVDAPHHIADVAGKVSFSPEDARQIAAREQQLSQLLASSLNDLGTANARQGDYKQALANFQEAEHWDVATPTLLHNLGVAAFRSGQFSESARALSLYLKVVRNNQDHPTQDDRSQLMLAMSYFSLGQFREADVAFTPIAALAQQDPRAAYSWAYSLAHSGQQQLAGEMADSLVKQEISPDNLSLVCHIYLDIENYEQSAACFRKAYAADPNLKLAHYEVAESLIHLDRPAEAVIELRQELVLSPDNPDVSYSLAFALLQNSHKSEAMEILEKLTTATPSHAPAQYQLGKALLEEGEPTEAIKHLELAEKADATPDYIHYQLQAAYRKAGRIADADRELQIYRQIKAQHREVVPAAAPAQPGH